MLSGKFVGAVIFGIAICLCLTVCSVPEMFAKKATAGHCHTEDQQEKEPRNDSQKHCCSGDSILPALSGCLPHDENPTMLPEESVFTFKTLIVRNSVSADRFLHGSSPPPDALILRI